jgi:Xaa-Pro aminopeptidase
MTERYFPTDEYRQRWQRLEQAMSARGYETAVVWGFSAGNFNRAGDILYLTNYYSNTSTGERDTPYWNARGFAGLIMQRGRSPELHIDENGYRASLLPTGDLSLLGGNGDSHLDVIQSVAGALRRRGITGSVALVGDDVLPAKYMRQLLHATAPITFVPEDDLVEQLRRIKSPRELACIREGAAIASRASDLLCKDLMQGVSQAEAAARASAEVIRAGGRVQRFLLSHGPDFYPPTDPLMGYSQESAQPGELIVAPLYGQFKQGYWSDPVRTLVHGARPSAAQRSLVEACADMVSKVVEAVRPGVLVAEVAAYADRLTREAGGDDSDVSQSFPYHGHGLGLFWEKPWIGVKLCDEGERFEENTVLGIEMFLQRPEAGFAAFEQNIIVTREANELLTTNPLIYW